MLTSIIRWFQPPTFPEDEDKTRSALLLNVLLNTTLIAMMILFIGLLLGDNKDERSWITLAVIAVVWLSIFGTRSMMLAGQVAVAGMTTAIIIFIATTLVLYNVGSIRAPATSFYIVATMIAGLTVSRRAILWMASLSSIAVIALVVGERKGLLPPPTLSVSITQAITFTTLFVQIGILLYLMVKSIDEALARVRQELTERRRAETRFRGLLESAPDAMVVVNSEGIVLLTNSQLQNIFGYASEEVVGKQVEMLIPKRFAEIHPSHREKYETNQRVRPMGAGLHLYALRKDGSEFPVEISLSPMESEDDNLIIAAIRDVTERVAAETERKRYIEKLDKQNAELERFTYTISHDLKSPVITIKGFLGVLQKDIQKNSQDRIETDLKRISDAAEKMSALLSELLELSRIGRIVNPTEAVDLAVVVQEAVKDLKARIRTNKVTIQVASDLPVIYSDPVRLKEVYANLIDNAIKHLNGKAAPQIEIGVRRESEDILFVKDNGTGIEPIYHEKIFGLFEKLDANSEGTGIGLALVKRIIETHGGRIWVESEGLGKGSTFCFTIPDNKK